LPESKDDDIVDLVENFKLAANVILAKVDMDNIMHATSTLDLWDVPVVLVVMTRFDLWEALANM